MEFDYHQPYFFDDFDTEEDFYKSTAPSEDIWKKFELLPTPPMSPTRTPLQLSPGDTLSWLSKMLGQDEEYEAHFVPDTQELFGNLNAHIIQDCMWSSFSANKQLEKVGGGRLLPSLRPAKAQCAPPAAGLLSAAAADCVDPAAVLSIPSNIPNNIPTNIPRKSASSGSESRSDSSDEDDDEEEIDVVTVESNQSRMRLVNVRKPVTIRVRADPCPKRFHMSVHRQQHNYAAPSPDSDAEAEEEEDEDDEEDDDEDEDDDDDDSDEEPPSKRSCTSARQQSGFSACTSEPASPSDNSQNSDVEDTDRRRNHNFLERKRRNDLRSRFLALRDEIPGLESSKTPKVVILTQATEYLGELHTREKRQLQEKKRLRSKQQQLLRRLSELKRS
ncbi:protein L-Myc-1b-like [Cololabis saira]|uniref:protein L-Myc-1b-like n=1 Tax=Cololabis saira TaxID=129043 RepID=UPI002AD53002|nr:protein L-Myc-1b-like [Cololabis saira]